MVNFETFAKNKKLSDDYYPFAEKGVKIFKKVYKNLQLFLLFFILFSVLSIGNNFIKIPDIDKAKTIQVQKIDNKKLQTNSKTIVISDNKNKTNVFSKVKTYEGKELKGVQIAYNVIKIILSFLANTFKYIGLLFFIIFIFHLFRYLINVVKRQRSYERNVIINDFKANNLKSKILRSTRLNKKLREAKNKSSKGDNGVSHADETDIEKLKAMKNVEINFNTRQSLESNEIDTQYRIKYTLPFQTDASEKLIKEIEKMDETATRLMKSKATFGKYFISTDRQFLIFRAWDHKEDPYLIDEKIKNKEFEEVKVESESSFPLSLLIDKQSEIDMKKDKAQQWANKAAKGLDMFLITSKNSVTRDKVDVGSSNALFIYSLTEDTNLPNFNKLDESIDAMFKIKGCSASINEGQLLITMPLPKNLALPINIPSMYKDAFG